MSNIPTLKSSIALKNWGVLNEYEKYKVEGKEKDYLFGVRNQRFVLIKINDSLLIKIWTQFLILIRIIKTDSKVIESMRKMTLDVTNNQKFQLRISAIKTEADIKSEPLFSLHLPNKKKIEMLLEEVKSLKKEVIEKNEEIRALKDEPKTKDTEISTLKASITAHELATIAKNEEIRTLKDEQKSKDTEISNLKIVQSNNKNDIANLIEVISKREIKIADLEKEIKKHEDVRSEMSKELGKCIPKFSHLIDRIDSFTQA